MFNCSCGDTSNRDISRRLRGVSFVSSENVARGVPPYGLFQHYKPSFQYISDPMTWEMEANRGRKLQMLCNARLKIAASVPKVIGIPKWKLQPSTRDIMLEAGRQIIIDTDEC